MDCSCLRSDESFRALTAVPAFLAIILTVQFYEFQQIKSGSDWNSVQMVIFMGLILYCSVQIVLLGAIIKKYVRLCIICLFCGIPLDVLVLLSIYDMFCQCLSDSQSSLKPSCATFHVLAFTFVSCRLLLWCFICYLKFKVMLGRHQERGVVPPRDANLVTPSRVQNQGRSRVLHPFVHYLNQTDNF